MEHLSLEIFDLEGTGSQFATMEEDASITITDTSEVFASGDVWSHSFTLNIPANAHIFGSSGDMHGSRLHEQINKRRARLWVEGLPLYLGYLKLSDEVDVDENGDVDVTFESGQKTFDEMIEGAKANQVPMMSDVMIGMALWRKRKAKYMVGLKAAAVLDNGEESEYGEVVFSTRPHGSDEGRMGIFSCDGEEDGKSVQQYPRMVFPRGEFVNLADDADTTGGQRFGGRRTGARVDGHPVESFDCINTDHPYDEGHPYCNVALCYQKYDYKRKDTSGIETVDYSAEPEAQRGYEVAPAYRLNSAPNFYVLYWLDCLMKHLGIHIDENQAKDVEDLRRLFFVNTDCAYYEPQKLRTVAVDSRYGKFKFTDNKLMPELFGLPETYEFYGQYLTRYKQLGFNVDTEGSSFVSEKGSFTATVIGAGGIDPSDIPDISQVKLMVERVADKESADITEYERDNRYLHYAIASSECFPDVDISEVIKALENGFGIRLLFDEGYKRVRVVLLKNLFRDSTVQDIACDIISEAKTENCIRGFKMTYGDSEDTTFYYKGFDDLLPHKKPYFTDNSDKHDYSHWNLSAGYGSLIKNISAFDKTCYYTPATGNAYGIKIDKDAKRYQELHPSLFEYAGYMDAEDGDCTGDDETIETISLGFKPAIMNDVNFEKEREAGAAQQQYALFVDATMRPRRPDLQTGEDYNSPTVPYNPLRLYEEESVASQMKAGDGIVKPGEFAIRSDMFGSASGLTAEVTWAKWAEMKLVVWRITNMSIDGHLSEGYRLYLQDNYEPNDDGISPLETKDWGLTLGIMRGSGGDAYVKYQADPDDGEQNDTWEKIAGSSVTAHPDTCDNYGNMWDYNGTDPGIGDGGRVSLKIRAEKLNPYFDNTKPESADNKRYLDISTEQLRNRGLMDTFYPEYSYWIRNARIARRTVHMELAQLLSIDKTKKVRVGDIMGFIRKMQYTVSNKTGLGMVTMEIMYI